jgi:hypothetical protein
MQGELYFKIGGLQIMKLRTLLQKCTGVDWFSTYTGLTQRHVMNTLCIQFIIVPEWTKERRL